MFRLQRCSRSEIPRMEEYPRFVELRDIQQSNLCPWKPMESEKRSYFPWSLAGHSWTRFKRAVRNVPSAFLFVLSMWLPLLSMSLSHLPYQPARRHQETVYLPPDHFIRKCAQENCGIVWLDIGLVDCQVIRFLLVACQVDS